jgi:hypothetical protein
VRSNVQQTNRYFSALWSVAALIIGAMVLVVILTTKSIPPWVFIIIIVLNSVAFGGLGFLHGITLFVAREHDARNVESTTDYLTED